MIAALMIHDKRSISFVASSRSRRYGSPVAANSVTGLGNPMNVRRNSAPITTAGAFFVPADPFYGGCAWEAFVPAGFLTSRFTNLRTAATHSLGNERGSSSTLGASFMHFSATVTSKASKPSQTSIASSDVSVIACDCRAFPTRFSKTSMSYIRRVRVNVAAGLSTLFKRSEAHRAMAIAALHADSSLSVRLSRYDHHMSIARSLETVGGVK